MAEFGGAQEADFLEIVADVELALIRGGCGDQRPEGAARGERALPLPGQPVKEGRVEMGLDGRSGVGGLHEVAASGAADLGGEAGRGIGRAEVLDDGVAEDEVERLVGEGQRSAVAIDIEDAWGDGFAGAGLVENDEARADGAEIPDGRRAADVEHEPVRTDAEERGEPLHPAAAEAGAETGEGAEGIHES